MKGRNVLITGGAGFLGTHLASVCSKRDASVRLLDITPSDPATPCEYIRADIRDPIAVAAAMDGMDIVIHAAFASPHQSSNLIRSVNVEGTRIVCEEALKRGVRVVLISSTIIEKPTRPHPFLNNSALTRLDRYRTARAEADQIASEFAGRGLSCALVRPKTFLGPGRVSAFAILMESVRLGKSVPILGSGQNRYQLLGIEDMAEGIRLLGESRATGVFHFGAKEFGTAAEDLRGLTDHADTGSRIKHIPGAIARAAIRAAELAGMVPLSEFHHMCAWNRDCVVDTTRAERELGWRPKSSNVDALKAAFDWYAAAVHNDEARSAHPVPASHRLLTGLARLLPG